MYNLPYAYAYALPDMRRNSLVLMHILIQSQSSYKSIFSYKTSDDAETHMPQFLDGFYSDIKKDQEERKTRMFVRLEGFDLIVQSMFQVSNILAIHSCRPNSL
jgi:hypothetical protein